MNGLQDLIMFRDNIQQPEMTGMDNLRNLQSMTMQSMADQQYANMAFGGLVDDVIDPNEAMRYAASGGIVSLPVVQAGFGGFLKKAVRAFNKIPAAKLLGRTVIRPLSKSKIGRFALTAAPMLIPGIGPFASAAIAASIAAMQDPKGQGNPYNILQSAGKAYAGAKIGQAMKGTPAAEGTSKYGGDAFTRSSYQPGSTVIGAPAPVADTASSSIFGDIGKSLTDTAYDPEGTVLSRLGDRIAGTGDFEGVGLKEQLGLPKVVTKEAVTSDYTAPNLGQQTKVLGSETLGKVYDAGAKLIPDSTVGKLAAGTAVVGGLSGLQGQPEVPQYDPGVYDSANIVTNFDKERMVYLDKTTGEEIPTQIALARLAEAYRSFNPRGKTSANIDSGIKTAFQDVNPLSGMIDLKSSGGLIGMAYGGQMPQDGLDVRYKEFSGMVGGQGDGMRDNVYMPIVERDNGQQVATLAVSPKEYVVDANTMSLLGNGNPDEGAEIMDETVKDIRMAATGQKKQQKEIDGLAALNRMRRV